MNLEQMDATSDDDHVDIIDGIVDLGIGQDNQRNNIRMKNNQLKIRTICIVTNNSPKQQYHRR
jgi:hypothetical protein